MINWKCAIYAVLSVGVLVFGSSVANAEPSKPGSGPDTPFEQLSSEQRTRLQAQDQARSAASQIRRAVERGAADGFTGIELRQGKVRLWYKGTPPAAVRTAIDRARGTAPVDVLSARYSLAELQAASQRMVQHLRAHPNGPAHRVSIPVDGSGLRVGVDAATVGRAADSLPDVGVPVQVVAQDRMHPLGRYDDFAPFYGGGKIVSDEWIGCTAGFGVRRGADEYLLTAGHCGYPGQGWRNGNAALRIGYASQENVGQDLLLIPTDAGSFIFTGVGSSTAVGHVYAWESVSTGEELCSSGAVTTWLCGHVVVDAGNSSYCDTDPFGNWECYSGLVLSRQEDGAVAGRHGDSGGPVVLPTPSGIIAKGTISGGGGNELLWQDFATASQILGITVVT